MGDTVPMHLMAPGTYKRDYCRAVCGLDIHSAYSTTDPDCVECRACLVAQDRDDEARQWINEVTQSLGNSQPEIEHAIQAVIALASNAVYHLGYAEGDDGADIIAHLRDAARHLRSASALHDRAQRQEG